MKNATVVMPEIDTLKANFIYDPETGAITNRINRARTPRARAGIDSGYISKSHGYRVVNVAPKTYLAHRVVWAMFYGSWPKSEIDHRNGIRTDNRIANLREATKTENRRNLSLSKRNTSGFKGVNRSKSSNRWIARICVDRKQQTLGHFKTKEEAAAAYAEASKRLHGEFSRLA